MSDYENTQYVPNESQQIVPASFANRGMDPSTIFLGRIKKNYLSFKNVPVHLKTDKFINISLKINPRIIELLTEEEQTLSRCLYCVKKDGLLLRWIYDQTDKADVIIAALDQNYEALEFVQNQTPDLCQDRIRRNPDAVRFMKIEDYESYCLAVHLNPSLIGYIPQHYQTDEILRIASNNVSNLNSISNPTPEIIANALNQDPDAMNNIEALKARYDYVKFDFDNSIPKVTYNENIKVLIKDHVNRNLEYLPYTKKLLDLIYDDIVLAKGEDGKKKAEILFSQNKTNTELIRQDPKFSGLFIIEKDNQRYQLWEREIVILPGGIFHTLGLISETVEKKTNKLFTYQLMRMVTRR